MSTPETFIGIDVSKQRLDAACRPTGITFSEENSPAGITTLIKQLKKQQPRLIILEATGGLERALVLALISAQLPVVVVNPRQIRDFARATGQLAKTDLIDAGVIAHFGEAIKPEVRPLPDEMTQQLDALLTQLRSVAVS